MNKLIDKFFIKQPRLRELVTRFVFGSSDELVNLLGADLDINVLKENGYWRAARASKRYSVFRDEISVIQNLASLMNDNATFVDVGANIGVFSACMSRLTSIYPEARVVAFEVDPDTFTRLSKNADRHGFLAYNVGLGDKFEQSHPFVRGAVSHVTTLSEKKNRYSIPDRSFYSNIEPLSHYDFGDNEIVLKIDVEGQELNVLMGAISLLERNRIRAVYLDGADHMEIIFDFLKKFGFKFYDGRNLRKLNSPSFSVLAIRN